MATPAPKLFTPVIAILSGITALSAAYVTLEPVIKPFVPPEYFAGLVMVGGIAGIIIHGQTVINDFVGILQGTTNLQQLLKDLTQALDNNSQVTAVNSQATLAAPLPSALPPALMAGVVTRPVQDVPANSSAS